MKLPGGALRQGEHLIEAVEREVLEETGVHSRFESVVCFRHWHGYRYGKSDIYFVCRLRPLSSEITMQTEEIQECLWMPVGEFLEEETVSEFNKWIVRAGVASPGYGSRRGRGVLRRRPEGVSGGEGAGELTVSQNRDGLRRGSGEQYSSLPFAFQAVEGDILDAFQDFTCDGRSCINSSPGILIPAATRALAKSVMLDTSRVIKPRPLFAAHSRIRGSAVVRGPFKD